MEALVRMAPATSCSGSGNRFGAAATGQTMVTAPRTGTFARLLRFRFRGRVSVDVGCPAHARHQQACAQSKNETKMASPKHRLDSLPWTLSTSMHACCQLAVTRDYRGTSLILRDLPSCGNAKVPIRKSGVSDLKYSRTATYAEITAGRTLSVTGLRITKKTCPFVQRFSPQRCPSKSRFRAFDSPRLTSACVPPGI